MSENPFCLRINLSKFKFETVEGSPWLPAN
jgi:hypothetical protein